MSIVQEILEELFETTLYHKGVPVNIFGIPKFNHYSKRTLRSTIDRLTKDGLIKKGEDGLILSGQGKKYVQEKFLELKQFNKPVYENTTKILLVMFDIPEEKKAHREWFRWHLKKFGYDMIQKSVWIGPDPLPKEFLQYVKEIDLKECIKTFKLAKPYTK